MGIPIVGLKIHVDVDVDMFKVLCIFADIEVTCLPNRTCE